MARRATAALALAIDGAEFANAPEPAPPEYYLKSAVLNLSVVGLRAARGCMQLVRAGYEPEALGLKRKLLEVHARIAAVVKDTSGEHARQWRHGPGPGTPRKLATKHADQGLFDLYSRADHADARAVWAWTAVPMPEVAEHHKGLIVYPDRDAGFSNAMLVEVAHEARDLAVVMAKSRGQAVDGLHALDAQLAAARERWYSGSEASPESDKPEPSL